MRDGSRGRRGEVPVEHVQRALDDSTFTATEIARNLGWYTARCGRAPGARKPDGSRLKRAAGLSPHRTAGKDYMQLGMNYDRAVEIVRASGGDPIDYDL